MKEEELDEVLAVSLADPLHYLQSVVHYQSCYAGLIHPPRLRTAASGDYVLPYQSESRELGEEDPDRIELDSARKKVGRSVAQEFAHKKAGPSVVEVLARKTVQREVGHHRKILIVHVTSVTACSSAPGHIVENVGEES